MKTLSKIILITLFIISMISCSNDDQGVTGVSAGVAVKLVDTEITIFDINKDLKIDLNSFTNAKVTNLDVFKGTTKIADAVISDNAATFNSSSLLPFVFPSEEEGKTVSSGSFDLDLVYDISGGNIPSAITAEKLSVTKAINLTDKVSSIKFKDSASTNLITYVTSTAGAKIDDIAVTWRKGETGTETDISTGFNIDKGTIDLKNKDYITYGFTKGDILIYSFTVSSGVLTDKVEAKIEIIPQPFKSGVSGNLGNDLTKNQINLLTGSTSKDDTFTGDIDFVGPQGFGAINNTVSGENYTVDIQFVKLGDTGASFYDKYNDVEQAKADFDAGTPSTSSQVVKDEIYAYKIVRNIGTTNAPVLKKYYGAILVGDITVINAGTNVDMALSFKENSIID
ncbi:hypothetical protein [Aquimarina macrocephali]|uniref:hypothetical protein n=1 Tax=Aquimarina macrocephali TaxID=666563 RepID=UPI0004679FA0|nr:hypothetical protein [Aquimarina macrocephali]